jgi:hypothetical protein
MINISQYGSRWTCLEVTVCLEMTVGNLLAINFRVCRLFAHNRALIIDRCCRFKSQLQHEVRRSNRGYLDETKEKRML